MKYAPPSTRDNRNSSFCSKIMYALFIAEAASYGNSSPSHKVIVICAIRLCLLAQQLCIVIVKCNIRPVYP